MTTARPLLKKGRLKTNKSKVQYLL